ncbi:serine hydrolase domain-containing protein [Nonomuraea sp. NPDC055795]
MRLLLLLCLLLTACAAQSPPPGPPVAAEAERLVRAGVRGAVVHVRQGERVWEAAAGTADGTRPLRTGHRFRIASVTKTFTAALVLQQVAEGRLALTDRVESLLPGVIATEATVAGLLSHTSGIGDYLTDARFTDELDDDGHLRPWPPRRLLKYAGKGEGYSNSNYILLGMILEKVSGLPYRELLRARITGPHALNATEYPAETLPAGLAHGVHDDGSPGSTRIHPSLLFAAGGVVSTAADVARFYATLFGSPAGSELRAGNHGVFTEKLDCGTTVATHSGMLLGYGGAAMATEDGEKVVVVQVSSTRPGEAIAAAGRLMCGL